jgi:hypothetical protein
MNGTVRGRVLVSPTCPVETPGDACDPAGIVATITFSAVGFETEYGKTIVANSDADGRYQVVLIGGFTYRVTVESEAALMCEETTVAVAVHEHIELDLMCDSGIR